MKNKLMTIKKRLVEVKNKINNDEFYAGLIISKKEFKVISCNKIM